MVLQTLFAIDTTTVTSITEKAKTNLRFLFKAHYNSKEDMQDESKNK